MHPQAPESSESQHSKHYSMVDFQPGTRLRHVVGVFVQPDGGPASTCCLLSRTCLLFWLVRTVTRNLRGNLREIVRSNESLYKHCLNLSNCCTSGSMWFDTTVVASSES
jgi:hypothetical protein